MNGKRKPRARNLIVGIVKIETITYTKEEK